MMDAAATPAGTRIEDAVLHCERNILGGSVASCLTRSNACKWRLNFADMLLCRHPCTSRAEE